MAAITSLVLVLPMLSGSGGASAPPQVPAGIEQRVELFESYLAEFRVTKEALATQASSLGTKPGALDLLELESARRQ